MRISELSVLNLYPAICWTNDTITYKAYSCRMMHNEFSYNVGTDCWFIKSELQLKSHCKWRHYLKQNNVNGFFALSIHRFLWSSGVLQGIRRYAEYTHLFFSLLWFTFKSPLILSIANKLFQETVYKRNYWPMDYLQVFFFFPCVDGLRTEG